MSPMSGYSVQTEQKRWGSIVQCMRVCKSGCVPVGTESIVRASQHCATICSMLPRQVEICVIPNAGWKVHLNVLLQNHDNVELLCHWADVPPSFLSPLYCSLLSCGQAACLSYESLGPEITVITYIRSILRKQMRQIAANILPVRPAQRHKLIEGSLHHK